MARPTAVTVIAVIGIVFAILGICCGGFGLLGSALTESMMGASPAGEQDINRQMMNIPGMDRYNLFSSVIAIILGFLLIIGSIGSLMMAGWARGLMVFYAMFAILANVGSTIIYFTMLFPEQQKIAANNPGAQAYLVGSYFGLGCGMIIGLIYPIAVLLIMNKPEIKSAFENKS